MGVVALVFDDRANIANAAPDAGQLHGSRKRLAGVGQVVAGDVAGVVAEHRRTGDDAFQRVLALNAAAEGEGLEEIAGGLAEGADRGAVPGVGGADAREAEKVEVAGRVADGEVESLLALVVVLQQRRNGRAFVAGDVARQGIALRSVVVGFAVEDLEADVEWLVAEIRLVEGEEKIAGKAAGVGLDAEGFAEAEEVVGLVIQAKEGAGETADASIQPDGVLALLLDLEEQIDGAGFGVLVGLGILFDASGD